MKKAFVLLAVLLSLTSSSQYIVNKVNEDFVLSYDNGSLVIKNTSFTREGYTSMPETNCKVALITKGGKAYSGVYGRIDLLTGKFIFTINEQDLICVLPVEQIVFDSCNTALNGAIFKNGYPPIDKQNDKIFYQLLGEGKATLLKHYELKWQDEIPYNSTNTTRIYKRSEKYYLYLNSKMYAIEKKQRNLLKLLAISERDIDTKKLNLKKEQDIIQLVAYYNML
jgi:hypothetical protein